MKISPSIKYVLYPVRILVNESLELSIGINHCHPTKRKLSLLWFIFADHHVPVTCILGFILCFTI